LQLDGDYSDDQLALPGREDSTLDSRTIINARIGYTIDMKSGSLELALWGKNIGDEEYTVSRFNQVADVYNEHVGAPRTYGIGARYSFE
jgi:outer membrane receptor protein involved in Fe transport